MACDVLVIGLDVVEVDLLDRWTDDGSLPTFALLRDRATTVDLHPPCMDTLPGGIWPELHTGVSIGRLGTYFHPCQLVTGEGRPRPLRPDEIDTSRLFWQVAARAGRSVLVVDPVQAPPEPVPGGEAVYEWGLHDRTFHRSSHPSRLLADIDARFGSHPVWSCDELHGQTHDGYRRLVHGLIDGLETKATWCSELLASGHHDLAFVTIAEGHCSGHQLWHLHDAGSRLHDPAAPDDLRDGFRATYRAIDRAVGTLVEAADAEQVFVVASHGMDRYVAGPHLLDEVLQRLDLTAAAPPPDGPVTRSLKRLLPDAARTAVRDRLVRSRLLIDQVGRAFEVPGTTARALPNNRIGAIRFNRVGREPYGTVGDEQAEMLVAELRSALLGLRHVPTGEPVVEAVLTPEEAFADVFAGPPHRDCPDLLVRFRRDLGEIVAVTSDRVGTIEKVPQFPGYWRSGDHTDHSRLWCVGGSDPTVDRASSLDVAPTVLSALGVVSPADLDGSAIPRS